MHIKLKNKKGLSLIELLAASILIGIVMVGVVSFSFSVKSQQDSTKKAANIVTDVTSAINYMKADAKKAIGDAIAPGIWCHADSGSPANNDQCNRSGSDEFYLCFRIPDNNITPTITNYSDDTWSCYYQDMNDNNTIWKCTDPISTAGAPDFVPSNYTNCSGDIDNIQLIKTINEDFAKIIYRSGSILYVEVTIDGISDTTQALHPIKNPGHSVTAYLNPKSHSK